MSRKLSAAEKAVQLAVEEQTREIKAELERANRRITRLEGVLRGISATALAAVGEQVVPKPPAPPVQEAPILDGTKVDLAGSDNLGEGRWI
jgi:hypothetical protein